MEFREYPMVEGAYDRRFTFSQIKWLSKSKFLERLSDQAAISQYCTTPTKTIHPHIINTNVAPSRNKNARVMQLSEDSDKIFIGKTIPKSPFESAAQSTNDFISSNGSSENHAHENHEIIGSVFSLNGSWRLRITHNGQVHDIDDDFFVLDLEPDSFYWDSNCSGTDNSFCIPNPKEIPQFSYRASIDQRAYCYIGRTIVEQSDNQPAEGGRPKFKRPKFYANAWLHFSYDIPQTFGKIKRPQKLLFAPVQNLELGFDQFETLCLKASPASLKVLCRSKIRACLNYSQAKIKSLNNCPTGSSSDKHLPDSLVAYLKYPNHLKVGEYMLADEKLVRDDDEFELAIDASSGHLVSRSCTQAPSRVQFDAKEQSTANKIHASNIDVVWLHRFHCCFYSSSNFSAFVAHSIYNSLQFYKFFIDWDKEEHTSQVIPIRPRAIVG